MAKLVRKQIYIEDLQNQRLKSRAKARRVSEAKVIRHAIDVELATTSHGAPDKTAWEREKAFIQERMKHPVKPASKRWTRDEVYEERLSRRH